MKVSNEGDEAMQVILGSTRSPYSPTRSPCVKSDLTCVRELCCSPTDLIRQPHCLGCGAMVGCSICTAEVEWILHHPSGLWTAKCHTCGCQASCEDGLITLDKSACKAPTSARPSATTTEGQKISRCIACKSSTGVAPVEMMPCCGFCWHGARLTIPQTATCQHFVPGARLGGLSPRRHQRKLSNDR